MDTGSQVCQLDEDCTTASENNFWKPSTGLFPFQALKGSELYCYLITLPVIQLCFITLVDGNVQCKIKDDLQTNKECYSKTKVTKLSKRSLKLPKFLVSACSRLQEL